VVAWI